MTNSYPFMNVAKYGWGKWIIPLVLLTTPLFISDYYLYYVNLTLIYSILTLGLNMVMGFTRMIHLGFAGLFGIGAYASVSSMLFFKWGYLPSVLSGALVASLAGFLLAIPAVRLSELGFALVTLAFGEAIVTALGNIDTIGGYNGLMVPSASIGPLSLQGNFRFFYFAFLLALVLFILYINIMKSRIGRALIALSDSEVGAQSLGVRVNGYRILVSAIASFYAGIAGGLFGPLVTFIDPSSFGISETLLLLMMLIIGGMGTYVGPVLGAALLAFMPEIIREFKEYRALVYGVALVAMIIFLPEGIWGRILIWSNSLFRRKGTAA